MNMKKATLIYLILGFIVLIPLCAYLVRMERDEFNDNYMWFDCEANYARLSDPDSIHFYLKKVKDLGFDNVVVDVKSIMGEVLYDSKIAPFMGEWKGVKRARNYDMLGQFIKHGHRMDMKVFASMNVFVGGHNFYNRGIIYGDKANWQSMCYINGEVVPITSVKNNYNGMLNPDRPAVKKFQKNVIMELVSMYPELDGIILDRVRYDDITSDFSETSRCKFEEYAGIKVESFPEDILSWYDEEGRLRDNWVPGKHFKKWVEYRASVIHDFIKDVYISVKEVNPDLIVGNYAGAWYPSYFQVGANWASKAYDPSRIPEYQWWASKHYHKTGYADYLDLLMTGLYYTMVTKDEVYAAAGVIGQRDEAAMEDSPVDYYSVEGGAELAMEVTKGDVPVIGSIYVAQYADDFSAFTKAVEQSIKTTGGVMIFDIVHLIDYGLWDELETALDNSFPEVW